MRCGICPRRCGAERTERSGQGLCGMPTTPVVARAALHPWEEPVLCGSGGAGTVFFSGCNLGCVYCQNHAISAENFGKAISIKRLREIFLELIDRGAKTIELVTATHFVPFILPALEEPLPVPVVYNCGGYESVETLRLLEGRVQVYLPDLKYADRELAAKLSRAADYFSVATAAIEEMFRQTGPCVIENGILKRGVLIRHLVLPGQMENTRRCLDWIAGRFRPGDVLVSLMSQYTPQPGAEGTLRRHVTAAEYRAAVQYMENCGITDGYVQERTSAREEYIPRFDLTDI